MQGRGNEQHDTHDRGAFHTLKFERCARGFTLTVYDLERIYGPVLAFDHIEDLAEWLVEQYSAEPKE